MLNSASVVHPHYILCYFTPSTPHLNFPTPLSTSLEFAASCRAEKGFGCALCESCQGLTRLPFSMGIRLYETMPTALHDPRHFAEHLYRQRALLAGLARLLRR